MYNDGMAFFMDMVKEYGVKEARAKAWRYLHMMHNNGKRYKDDDENRFCVQLERALRKEV